MWWKVLFSSCLYEGLYRELKKCMCFHSFFIFIGAYALDWVRINGFAPSTIIRIGNKYSIWLMYDKWGLHVGYILKLDDSWECGMHSLYPWKFAENYFRPLPYTFRLLSGGEIQHRYIYIILASDLIELLNKIHSNHAQ